MPLLMMDVQKCHKFSEFVTRIGNIVRNIPHDTSSGQLCHTEEFFRNPIKSTLNQIGFTIFQLIWN